jgi:hypothetical protein
MAADWVANRKTFFHKTTQPTHCEGFNENSFATQPRQPLNGKPPLRTVVRDLGSRLLAALILVIAQ